MRALVFASAVLFIVGLALLTILDIRNNGVTFVGVLGIIVLIVCGVGVIGALLHPPRK